MQRRGTKVAISYAGQVMVGTVRDQDEISISVELESGERYGIAWEAIAQGLVQIKNLDTAEVFKQVA